MRVCNVKINGMDNPMGYVFSDVIISWKVTDTSAEKQKESIVSIAVDPEMSQIIWDKKGCLPSNGVTADIQLKPRSTYYVQVQVTGENGDHAVSDTAFFDTGKMDEPWQAMWIAPEEQDKFHPVFETHFSLKKKVKRARLYISGVGVYEAYLNHRKIGKDHLAPFFNDYNCAIQSQTYDVKEIMEKECTLSIMLGNGWYKGRLGYEGRSGIYGDRFACIAELHLEYEDDTEEVIATDETWNYYQSDIEFSDIYDGEIINRLICNGTAKEKRARKCAVIPEDMKEKKLTDRYSMGLEEMEELQVKEILHTPAGETVLDFGQNFSGYVMFHVAFKKGTKVVLDHGEVLQNGNFYHANYRTAKTEIVYISDGREEWVKPHFTYMGFRYVKIAGWPYEVKKEDFIGKVIYSSMERTGFLETGHKKVNRLISNALWGMKSNFLDMPTDCPQRDERLGWTGDAQVFASTASFFMDTRAFYRKFLWDMRNDQKLRGGAIANYLPNINGEQGGSSVWGDAATFIPTALYEIFGNESALREKYPLMKDWVEWIRKNDEKRENGPKYLFDFSFTFGDWLAMDGITPQSYKGATDDTYISSVYYYASVKKLAKASKIIGARKEYADYLNLAEKIKEAILFEYFTSSGRLAVDTQTGYIIALYFGIYRDKEILKKQFRLRLQKDCFKIKCGFVGAPLLCEVLADNGMDDLAFHIFLQEDFPSWLHCVNLGATTIWERWNSILEDGSISGTGMNSLNHYAYGSIVNYIVRNIAGLKPLIPGYRKVQIRPQFNAWLGHINCTYKSASGTYVANWKINPDGTISVHYEIPFDCEAILCLPDCESGEMKLSAGITNITYRPQQDYSKLFNWNTILEDCGKSPEAMKILKEELPALYKIIQTKDREYMTFTLGELRNMPWFGFPSKDMEKVTRKLFELSF